jgi:hypothetical protein
MLLDKKETEVNPKPLCFIKGRVQSETNNNQIHCPMKGPNIMNKNENMINIEKLTVIELETFSETESFLVSLYIKE